MHMKTINILFRRLTLTLVAVFALGMLTSCDEDIAQARVLSGEWRGNFGMYYDYTNRNGQTYTFDSYDTRLVFYPNSEYSARGWGKQVDYYASGPYTYQYYRFYWEIRDGIVYLSYPQDPNLDVAIADYVMDNGYFAGRFVNTGTRFSLTKLADFDWSVYTGDYGYYSRYGYDNYTKGEAFRGQTGDTIPSENPYAGGSVILRGNRFAQER